MGGVRVGRKWRLFVCMRGKGRGGLRHRRGCEWMTRVLGYRLDTGVVFHIFISHDGQTEMGKWAIGNYGCAFWEREKGREKGNHGGCSGF